MSAFHAHGVKYIIVGGYAGIFRAQPRATKDIGLLIGADPGNAQAAHAALAEFGVLLQNIRPEDFADRSSFFRSGRNPCGVDILPDIPGVDFDAAWERRVEGVIDPASGLEANYFKGRSYRRETCFGTDTRSCPGSRTGPCPVTPGRSPAAALKG